MHINSDEPTSLGRLISRWETAKVRPVTAKFSSGFTLGKVAALIFAAHFPLTAFAQQQVVYQSRSQVSQAGQFHPNYPGWFIYGGRAPSPAFRQACEQHLGPSSLTIKTPKRPHRYILTRSIDELTALGHGPEHRGHDHKGRRVLGLTEFNYTLNASLRSVSISGEGDYVCLRPHLQLVIDSGEQKISVAREFPKGSCAFQAILEHELRHGAVNNSMAKLVGEKALNEMRRYYGQTIFYGPRHLVSKSLSDAIEAQWFPWLHNQMMLANVMHEKIDSPAEDARMQSICGGEIQLRMAIASLPPGSR